MDKIEARLEILKLVHQPGKNPVDTINIARTLEAYVFMEEQDQKTGTNKKKSDNAKILD